MMISYILGNLSSLGPITIINQLGTDHIVFKLQLQQYFWHEKNCIISQLHSLQACTATTILAQNITTTFTSSHIKSNQNSDRLSPLQPCFLAFRSAPDFATSALRQLCRQESADANCETWRPHWFMWQLANVHQCSSVHDISWYPSKRPPFSLHLFQQRCLSCIVAFLTIELQTISSNEAHVRLISIDIIRITWHHSNYFLWLSGHIDSRHILRSVKIFHLILHHPSSVGILATHQCCPGSNGRLPRHAFGLRSVMWVKLGQLLSKWEENGRKG